MCPARFVYITSNSYHSRFMECSSVHVCVLECIRAWCWVCWCFRGTIWLSVRSHTRVSKASESFLCYLICEPRHTTSPRRVFVLAQLFAIVFLLQEKKSLFFICVKFLRVSTWFFGCFQVNQKLTNSLDFCNRKYSSNNKCNLHTTL